MQPGRRSRPLAAMADRGEALCDRVDATGIPTQRILTVSGDAQRPGTWGRQGRRRRAGAERLEHGRSSHTTHARRAAKPRLRPACIRQLRYDSAIVFTPTSSGGSTCKTTWSIRIAMESGRVDAGDSFATALPVASPL